MRQRVFKVTQRTIDNAESVVLRQTYILSDTEQMIQIHAIPDPDNVGTAASRSELNT